MMSKEVVAASVCTGISVVATGLQTNQVFATIQIIITCISGILTIAMMIYNWYKAAKSDGKIDADEVKDLINQVKDEVDNIDKKINKDKTDDRGDV